MTRGSGKTVKQLEQAMKDAGVKWKPNKDWFDALYSNIKVNDGKR